MLLNHAMKKLKKRGCPVIEIYVKQKNVRAQRFYTREGFERKGVAEGYIKYELKVPVF